ncbi:hypothetical protein GON26_15060 [Flavobacterium sp. GA093]|uniref:Uncharacterized protein n=1 Tax=Flavobacterium hydrocarbonoxydans TaxID=2683249 RepID=A0A6I4NT55_9FLAO|nr:hypothetical protein [Flavobacterium hydrocarbonoxydans]MWB95685.1 hypothetical protein [Flavobacterium hydrocarbonoxydans]
MNIRLIVILILLFPFFVNAQNFKPVQIQPPFELGTSPFTPRNPKLPQLETVKPISQSHVQNMRSKLARKEQEIIKLEKKIWADEDDLKEKLKNLENLENATENSNDPDHQKKIENSKKQIAKSQSKLNEAEVKLKLKLKKLEDLEKALEEAKFKRIEN